MSTLPELAAARVLVVGDVMLDRYWFGEVERISPEAPVPIVRVGRVEERPGGAANVARNVASLGSGCTLLSVIGDDDAGRTLTRLMTESGVSARLRADGSLSTTVKLRVVSRQQQLIRIDFENAPSHEVLAEKLDEYGHLLEQIDVVILSDYGKGGLAHVATMIERARAAGKPVLVDPKGDDYSKYHGATLVTPNRAELREVVGRWSDEADLERRAQGLRESLDLEALLLTRSEEGMSLYTAQGVFHEPAKAREVYDVSGAGDTVIATLAAALACGSALAQAVHIANLAAGIVVGRLGTAVVLPVELEAALAGDPPAGRTGSQKAKPGKA
jgi:D-glycero-beta-D-manno-heptose-7-phosphate kinase